MLIRNYRPTDLKQIVYLFYIAIHIVNFGDYTLEQVNAWVPNLPNEVSWLARCAERIVFVADDNGVIAGFAELEPNGHVDL
jgi:putative acetyltransferase